MDVLGAYGLTEQDINPTYQSFGDSADSLKNGQIDAAFIVAGAPTTAVTDLATTKDVYLVSLDDEHVDKLLASSPYYTKVTISKDVYGLDSDTITVAVSAVSSPATTFPRTPSTSWSPISSTTPPVSPTPTPSTRRSAPSSALPLPPSPIIRARPSISRKRALTFPPSKLNAYFTHSSNYGRASLP